MATSGCGLGTALSLTVALFAGSAAQQPAEDACRGAAECRAHAEQAMAQGEFERAHDLAWRAAQQGPRNDPATMYLLARTQALSRRPDDALVMLRRMAEMGIAPDASGDDFQSARELPAWPAVEALIDAVKNRVPEPLPARAPRLSGKPLVPVRSVVPDIPGSRSTRDTAASAATPAPADRAPALVSTVVENGGSFASPGFLPGGLACDAVSKRYVFGDRPGRKIRILAEGSDHSIDLTRAVSAGFLDVMALDIDRTNGTLWVASAEPDGRDATLHRLQLISGRAISSHRVAASVGAARLVDIAVTATGAVLLLDTEGRLLALRRGATDVELLTQVPQGATTSLALNGRGDIAYVAHREGVSRIDLRTHVATPLRTRGDEVRLAGIEALRHYRSGLIAVQVSEAGTRRIVRLSLDRSGAAVTALRVLDVPLPSGPAPQVTVCGMQLAVLAPDGETWTFRKLQLRP